MNIQNMVFEELSEYFMSEDYPASFNHDEFAKLRTFAERVRYCTQHLQKIGSGTSRIVYKIDDKSVLKLAKNPKGIAQNELEVQLSNDYYIRSMVATVYNSHPKDEWIESELANKLTPNRFKELTGVDIKLLNRYLWKRQTENKGGKISISLPPEQEDFLDENEFAQSIVDLMMNYDMSSGDLGKLSSYGEVNRGEPTVVVIDYGLNEDVFQDFYQKKVY